MIGLGRGDDDFLGASLDRHDPEALGIGFGHDLRDRAEIELERVDVVIVQARALGQPHGQAFHCDGLVRGDEAVPTLLADDDQRMQAGAVHLAVAV